MATRHVLPLYCARSKRLHHRRVGRAPWRNAASPGVARSAFKPLGQQGSRIFGFLSPQGRIDQHFLEQIALRMAAADAPDFIPHGHKLADRTAMVAAAAS
jgi:hypothetical protein